ncbi:hypothetical protein ACLWBD_00505 [Bdellovibrio sp. HCB117]|uniref:hypothetical protein n=1 Tax=Bdellovibrio sp. HCB117 TaxID=3394359 RepID=UPI0039B50E85
MLTLARTNSALAMGSSNEILMEIEDRCQMVFVPYEQWQSRKGPIISKDIWPLLDFIQANYPSVNADILIDTDQFIELGLHGTLVNLGKILLKPTKEVTIGVLIGLLTVYATKALEGDPKGEVRIEVVRELASGEKISISYSGPPSEMEGKILDVITQIDSRKHDNLDQLIGIIHDENITNRCSDSDHKL